MCREKEIYKVEIKAPGIQFLSYPIDEDDLAIIERIVEKIKRDAAKASEVDESGWNLIEKIKPKWPIVNPFLEFWDSEKLRTVTIRENEVNSEEWPENITHWRFMIGPALKF